jgi:endonuclease/exonuclease/phosphatase (EEP) superfamily protein YafD
MAGAERRAALSQLLLVQLVLVATATALAGLAGRSWPGELATHFRPQYVVVLALLAASLAALGQRRSALIAALFLVPNLWQVGPYLQPWLLPPRVAVAVDDVTLTAVNLRHRNTDYAGASRYLASSDPDVLVLVELTPQWSTALRPLLERYPHWLTQSRRSPWGLGVFSRYPLDDARVTNLGVRGSSNVLATLQLPQGPVSLAAVHLVSPTSAHNLRLRDGQLGRLARLLGAAPGDRPRLVLGNMNVTVHSPVMQAFLRATGLVDARRPYGLLGTWPVGWPLLQIQIDHCLVDRALEATRITRGPAIGSDHFPLEVRIRHAAASRKGAV